jgi:hypothetical protein
MVWSIRTCASLPRWVPELGFQVDISLEYGPFEKLNRSNWIRLYGFFKMIFLVWILKSVNGPFGMENDQGVIIKFVGNEGANARQIAARLQAQIAGTDC